MHHALPALDPYSEELISEGLLTKDQLAVAKVSQETLGENLGFILIKKGFLKENQLLEFLSRHIHIPFVSLKQMKPDPELLREIPAALARRHTLLPLKRNRGGKIEIAMANPLDSGALDDL